MTTAFYVIGEIDLTRVVSARVELVMDTGEVVVAPALHADRAWRGQPHPARKLPHAAKRTIAPRHSRKIYRSRGGKR